MEHKLNAACLWSHIIIRHREFLPLGGFVRFVTRGLLYFRRRANRIPNRLGRIIIVIIIIIIIIIIVVVVVVVVVVIIIIPL